ncbi:MAG: class B sortase [Clostridia bacterium]|nr:class B sortase [Clostridia bacterium]
MKKFLYWLAIILLAAVFLFAAFMIFRHYYDARKSAESFDQLNALVPEEPAPEEETAPTAAETYGAIAAQNSDFVGWIKIEGTRIDYPVMQTPDSPNYYIRRGFDKKYSYYGVPYAAENCNVNTSSNVVIYGHNMNNGSMFSDLEKYYSYQFYEAHPYIQFDTLEGFGTYQIVAVFKTVAGSDDEFAYFRFADGNEERFNSYIEKCKALSLYEIKIPVTYGDRLITLSTCEYSKDNGRLAVVAKKIN